MDEAKYLSIIEQRRDTRQKTLALLARLRHSQPVLAEAAREQPPQNSTLAIASEPFEQAEQLSNAAAALAAEADAARREEEGWVARLAAAEKAASESRSTVIVVAIALVALVGLGIFTLMLQK